VPEDFGKTTRVLVTGGAGFIGGNFIHHLLETEPVQVANLDLLTYAGHLETLLAIGNDPRHRFQRGDIADRETVRELIRHFRPRYIVNFAAESHVDRSIDDPGAFVHTNINGTHVLLDEALGYWRELPEDERAGFRFLQVSTDEVYGALGDAGAFTETTPYAPRSPYSASKAAADHLVRAWHHTYGLPTLITNCSNNYGPFQFPEKLIPLMILNAVAGRPLPVYGSGRNVRDWLYVRDHCRALWAVLERGRSGETYNVGGNSERTTLQVVEALCRILDERLPTSPHRPHLLLKQHVTDRPAHDWRYAIDATKLRTELGWTPAETFESGLSKTVDWYLANSAWCEAVRSSGSYQGERLGLSVAAGVTELAAG
jgi:dTDP-glucose 4,6-dehydratase